MVMGRHISTKLQMVQTQMPAERTTSALEVSHQGICKGEKKKKCLKESPEQIKSSGLKTKGERINFSTDMKCSESDKSCH